MKRSTCSPESLSPVARRSTAFAPLQDLADLLGVLDLEELGEAALNRMLGEKARASARCGRDTVRCSGDRAERGKRVMAPVLDTLKPDALARPIPALRARAALRLQAVSHRRPLALPSRPRRTRGSRRESFGRRHAPRGPRADLLGKLTLWKRRWCGWCPSSKPASQSAARRQRQRRSVRCAARAGG